MSNYQFANKWLRCAGGDFNWFQLTDGSWRVRPTALGLHNTPWHELTDKELAAINNPPLTKRNQNTIGTQQKFVDFHLTLEFRCPNARDVFTVSHDPDERIAKTRGACNWGNSGVKIFTFRPGEGAEVQILDSTLPDASVLDAITPTANSELNDCSTACAGYVPIGQLCGAIYMRHAPEVDAVYASKGWPVPEGEWNTLDIRFKSRRISRDSKLIANAEIAVLLNGYKTYAGPLDCSLTKDVVHLHDNVWAETGRIYLQEHDNMVEFRNISIVPVVPALSSTIA